MLEWRLGKEQRERDNIQVENLGNDLKHFIYFFPKPIMSLLWECTVHSGSTKVWFMCLACLISSSVGAAFIPCAFSQWGDSVCPGGSHHADLPAVCLLHHEGDHLLHCYAKHDWHVSCDSNAKRKSVCHTTIICPDIYWNFSSKVKCLQCNNMFSVFLTFFKIEELSYWHDTFSKSNERKVKQGASSSAICSSPDDQDVQQEARKENNQGIKSPVCHWDSVLIGQSAPLPDHTASIMTWERDGTP